MHTQQKKVLISPVSIDLGAINTGLYLNQYFLGDTEVNDFHGHVVRTSESKLIFSMRNRTARRHQVRSCKRRKLAKRLFRIILRDVYNIEFFDLDQTEQDLLNGFFNRRGFSYFQEELDTAALSESLELLSDLIPSINTVDPIDIQVSNWAFSHDIRHDIRSSAVIGWTKAECNAYLKRKGLDLDGNFLFKAITALKKTIDSIDKNVIEGHKPRVEYLNNIKLDIGVYWYELKKLNACGLLPEELANLIGHISNLQLRCLRRYFNNPDWKDDLDGKWDSVRLAKYFSRYVKAWHNTSGDLVTNQNRQTILEQLRNNPSVIELWKKTDPSTSIPPMEDQNNRRPPKCSSLLLNEDALNELFPMWKDWLRPTQFGLDDCFKSLDLSRQLQCIFDRTSRIDIVNIRVLSNSVFNDKAIDLDITAQREILESRIGPDYRKFLECAGKYYKECELAAQGTWHPEVNNSLLKLCNINPPHKKQVLNILIGHLLGIKHSMVDTAALRSYLKSAKVCNTSLLGIAKKAAEMQKTYGQSFHEVFHSTDGNNNDVVKLKGLLISASELLGNYLSLENRERLVNPFIMAQLYNLLETDPQGFSSTCRKCTFDNALRSQTSDVNKEAAYAKRLPSDASQPFDGLVNKLMKRLAYEIAKHKISHITKAIRDDGPISTLIIPVIIEENRFEFASDLAQIKREQMGAKVDTNKLKRIKQLSEAKWLAKEQRIKTDGLGLCPYCGQPIDETSHGEIDHIYPRSFSMANYGVVFNIEPNLIYAHASCNRRKADKRYFVNDLAPQYLMRLFGTSDVDMITNHLKSQVSKYLKKGSMAFTSFFVLSQEERSVIRHSLFIDHPSDDLTRYLNQQAKTKVNGTQRWLVRHIAKELRSHFANTDISISILPYRIDAIQISDLRRKFATSNGIYSKLLEQSAYSHIIDAYLAYLYWTATNQDARDLLGSLDMPDINKTDKWAELIPNNFNIHTVKSTPIFHKSKISSKSIFSATIYGHHFLSFIICPDGTCKLGFSSNNSIPINIGSHYLFSQIKQFMKGDSYSFMTFDEALNCAQSKGMILIMPLSKTRIYSYLYNNKVSDDPVVLRLKHILRSISYFTVKADVSTLLFKGKALNTYEELNKVFSEDSAKFKINIELNDKSIPLSATGNLTFPSLNAWRSIAYDSTLAAYYGHSLPNDFDWNSLLNKYFYKRDGLYPNKAHKPVRKIYSLPVVNNPSGGFIVQRRTQSGRPLWQVLRAEDFAYDGFTLSQGIVDFNKPAVLKHLASSNDLMPVDFGNIVPMQTCKMDEWQEIVVDDNIRNSVVKLEMAPHSSPRQAFRVMFNRAFFEISIVDDVDARLLPNEFKVHAWQKGLIKPRDGKVSMIDVTNDTVTVEYISESKATKALIMSYNRARLK